ncbi:MAG: PrsW family intramembrane metalloprotease [Treponema sp.]|jgi:RsiW-degrading membrane proteinase PrsW (M82 family)|nr:PrsW family intramembrane metalloprotease [Treponema sp.]
MNSIWILFFLILISALPVFLLYIWLRARRYRFSLLWFAGALLAGVVSFFLALFTQSLIPRPELYAINSRWTLPGEIFLRIALTEELGRLVVSLVFFSAARRFGPPVNRVNAGESGPEEGAYGPLTGLLAGLGFVLIESASYGSADAGIALLRAFTAAPLHGACGARVGKAALNLRYTPFRAITGFLSAVAIHGTYNFMLLLPGFPSILAILIAFSAFASTILLIRGEISGDSR